MLKFTNFMQQLYIVEAASQTGAYADAQGKVFELEFARHLHSKKQHAEHFRNEEGKSPVEVSRRLREILGDEQYNKISQHAMTAVNEYKKRAEFKHPDEIAWTSQPSDHKSFTGSHDPNSNADVMYRHGKQYRGLSLKYGKTPGVRSPGMKDLSTLLKTDHSKIETRIAEHRADINSIMGKYIDRNKPLGTQHQEFKAVVASGSKAAQQAADTALQASRDFRAKLVSHYAKHFNKLTHEDKTHAVRRLLSANETLHPHDKIHYDTSKNEVHISNPVEEFNTLHGRIAHYTAEAKGGYLHIHAHTPDGNKHHILKISIKNKSSSPYTNIVGAASHGKDYKKLITTVPKPEKAAVRKAPKAPTVAATAAPKPVEKIPTDSTIGGRETRDIE